MDCTMELPPSLFEAKGSFVLLSQSAIGHIEGKKSCLNSQANLG